MKQAFLTDNGFEIRDVPRPVCGQGQVLVRTIANGVCSSDLGVYKDTPARLARDIALGHESSGEVVAVGSSVCEFKPGDFVTALGGSFADYNLFDPQVLTKLPTLVDPVWALGEPVACCVHAMNRSRVKTGDRVAVVGCGMMGLICLQLAKQMGASDIVAIDVMPSRLAMALRLGAQRSEDAAELSRRTFDSGLDFEGDYDVVIEATGNQAALDLCGYLVRQHGLLNLVGHHYSSHGRRTVYMNQWNVKAIDVVNGHVRRDDEKHAAMQQGMQMAGSGQLLLEPLITRFPLSKIGEAFAQCLAGKDDLFKAVITPD